MDLPTYSITMFAYNEEHNIARAVKSIFDNSDDQLARVVVIANGCTDNTAGVLKALSNKPAYDKLEVIELALGDKCNAWNHYVHDLAGQNDVHFLVDADVSFTKNAFPRMAVKLMADERANAVAGLPFSGRNQSQYEDLVVNGWCLFGNCYGVKHRFLELLRERHFRLPIGLGWIDSEITKAIHNDVGLVKDPAKGRIICDPECGYEFESLSLLKKDDWSLYLNRITRYKLGQMQEVYLDQLEYADWPDNLLEINKRILAEIPNNTPWYDLKSRVLVSRRIKKFINKFRD